MTTLEAGRGFIEALGIRHEYLYIPPAIATDTTLILLHEGLGCVALWRDFPQKLAEKTGAGVFAYSRRGYGGSDTCPLPRPLTYMHDEGEKILPALINKAGFSQFITVGHSDGGSIAAIHAGANVSPKPKAVILLAPHFFTETIGLGAIKKARTAFDTGDLRIRLAKYHGQNVDCAFNGWCNAWLNPEFKHWNIESYLPQISVPVLAMQGTEDPYGSPKQLEQLQELAGAETRLILFEDCGHNPIEEKPMQVLDKLSDFIAPILL